MNTTSSRCAQLITWPVRSGRNVSTRPTWRCHACRPRTLGSTGWSFADAGYIPIPKAFQDKLLNSVNAIS